ncbi:major facilitator transporter [Photobacterium angustum]|uniref:Bcr/CflA family efflux transporter n=1 Tax=Photobacterium angustum TaxID=661 RepID=A0ABX5GYV5_PHOAN|nr:multidrug efflux MFS transporter EmrD [Photobacterium angustum]KJG40676.1 major facilitator transporter [Photobacterium angustum]PSX03575.1 multidrug transporter EmrD [Photobacterium angustum]
MVVVKQSSSNMGKFLFLLIIFIAVGQMTQTMYVPAIPEMATFFGVRAASLQAVMAAYLIPYGLSQFVYGPLSDRIGRRPVMISGMVIFLIGTVIALVAPSFDVLLLASFIQGMGTGTSGAMSRTVTRDCYDGDDLHKVNSLVSMGVIFSPLIAPVLGGYLSEHLGWESIYIFLLGFGALVTLALMRSFGETLPVENRRAERVWVSYRYVLSNRRFQGYVVCLIATFAGVATFEASAGVLLGSVLKLDPSTVSWLFIVPLPGYLLGSWGSNKLMKRLGTNRVLFLGMFALLTGAITIIIPGMEGLVTVTSLIGGAFIYFIGAGVLFPAATTLAIQPFPHHAGTAGAVLGGLQNLGAGLATLAASAMSAQSQFNLGAVLSVMAIIVVLSLVWIRRSEKNDITILAS